MPEEDRPKPHHKVNVLVSVDVPNLGTLGTCGHDRIDHLLPELLEPGGASGIRQVRPMLLGELLGACCAPCVPCDQLLQVPLLLLRQATGASVNRPEWTVCLRFDLDVRRVPRCVRRAQHLYWRLPPVGAKRTPGSSFQAFRAAAL